MKYCSQCGEPVSFSIPRGDDRERYHCAHCGTVHYQNPRIVAGTIPLWEDQVLLCRRAIEPRTGLWTLPAGFMELGETTSEAAMRETLEEANAEVEIGQLYSMFSIPYISQVHIFFHAKIIEGKHFPGEESLETKLFSESEMPWEELAFETVKRTLYAFFEDRREGQFRLRVGAVEGNFKSSWNKR